MKHFLREAFGFACNLPRHVDDAYTLFGFTLWRALTDDTFLAVEEDAIQSPFWRGVAGHYEAMKGRAQEAAFEHISLKGAAGDVHPKPDIKPGLYKLAGLGYAGLTRLPPAMLVGIAASMGLAAVINTCQRPIYQAAAPAPGQP